MTLKKFSINSIALYQKLMNSLVIAKYISGKRSFVFFVFDFEHSLFISFFFFRKKCYIWVPENISEIGSTLNPSRRGVVAMFVYYDGIPWS